MSNLARRYRLYPSRAQETLLLKNLNLCRELYNSLLEERKTVYEETKKSVSVFEQKRTTLLDLKEERPELKNIYSQVLQDVVYRVHYAFEGFFRRVKNNETPGYPRFKGFGQYHSLSYTQGNSFSVSKNSKNQDVITFAKLGTFRFKYHRPIKGTAKTCIITRTQIGKWFVSIVCEYDSKEQERQRLPPNKSRVGIDAGLKTFAVLSNGEKIKNPRFFARSRKALAKVQRRKERLTFESTFKECQKVKKQVAKVHEKVKNRRQDFCHKEAKKIIDKHGLIAVEDLNIESMKQDKKEDLGRSISDAAWGYFSWCLSYRAENAGRRFIKVDPRDTSQTCSKCGEKSLKKLTLGDRVFECHSCGLIIDRDLNASVNILLRALATERAWGHTPCYSTLSVL